MNARQTGRPQAKPVQPQDMDTKGQGDELANSVKNIATHAHSKKAHMKVITPLGESADDMDESALLTDVDESIRPMTAEEKKQEASS